MHKSPLHQLKLNLSQAFDAACSGNSADNQPLSKPTITAPEAPPEASVQKKTSPICIRVTDDERARLEADAGKTALSAYIRTRLFDDAADRAKRYRKKRRQAEPDSVLIAKLLGMLGQDDMVKALFGLLVAAEADRVSMSDEAQESLSRACSQIDEMRDMLVVALGVKPQSKSRP